MRPARGGGVHHGRLPDRPQPERRHVHEYQCQHVHKRGLLARCQAVGGVPRELRRPDVFPALHDDME